MFARIRYEQYIIRDESIRKATVFEPKKFIIRSLLYNIIVRDPANRRDLFWIPKQLQDYRESENSPDSNRVSEQKFSFPPMQLPAKNQLFITTASQPQTQHQSSNDGPAG